MSIAIYCAPMQNYDGLYLGNNTVELSYSVCSDIWSSNRDYSTAYGVFVLSHEMGHANDPSLSDYNYAMTCGAAGPCEDYADCWAAGHMYDVSRALGFSGYDSRRFVNMIHDQRYNIGYDVIPQRCFP